jgi:hypothetical protein
VLIFFRITICLLWNVLMLWVQCLQVDFLLLRRFLYLTAIFILFGWWFRGRLQFSRRCALLFFYLDINSGGLWGLYRFGCWYTLDLRVFLKLSVFLTRCCRYHICWLINEVLHILFITMIKALFITLLLLTHHTR